MLKQALAITVKILLFRAGPEDFPFQPGPALTRGCIAAAIFAIALLFGLSAPPLVALAAGAVIVGGLSLFVRMALRLRKLDHRFVQTLNALLATGTLLILVMRLPLSQLMPLIIPFVAKVQQDPTFADTPGNWPVLPSGSALLLDLLVLWLLAVAGHIFRRACDVGMVIGWLIGLLCTFNVLLFLVFTAPLLAIFA